jgi:hypothetical protein
LILFSLDKPEPNRASYQAKEVKFLEKKIYTAPTLSVYGNLKQITQAGTTGDKLDASFPAGTKLVDVTLS